MKSIVFFAGLAWQVSAGGFLAHLPLNMTRNASDPKFKQALFNELEEILGGELSTSTKKRVDGIETLVEPMFVALPKNAHGKLDPSAVKYVLHRLFMKRQGWVISGLEPTGEEFDPSKGSSILEDKAPQLVQELFKKRIGGHGSGLHEIAVLGAMMEHLIFEDMLGKLSQAYKAKQISTDETVTRTQAQELLNLHMAAFIRARDVSEWTPVQIGRFEKLIFVLYPNWKVVSQHMLDIQNSMAPDLETYSFDDVAGVAAEVGSLFAHWQNDECKGTRQLLHDMEEEGTGRVSLVNFYNAALHEGKYQFTETINYLRHIGTLDESDELHPRVIIPNYIVGRSNCVARTSYYSVCCLDECEDLFGSLERKLGKPSATVTEITSAVEGFDKWETGLSPLLRRRLDELAMHHNGLIPLHGRLFAQWMHLAYPHECQYPHKTGTVYYDSMEKWEAETGERSGSTMKEIEHWSQHLGQLAASRGETAVEEDHMSGMWSMEEELVVHHKPVFAKHDSADTVSGGGIQVWALSGAGLLGAALVSYMLSSYASKSRKGGLFGKQDKWCV